MLYRIHEITPRSKNTNQGLGTHVGYAQLCSSITNGDEVRDILIKSGLFPDDWCSNGKVVFSKYQPIKVDGHEFHSFVLKTTFHEREIAIIAYLYPVPSKKDIAYAQTLLDATKKIVESKPKGNSALPLGYYTTITTNSTSVIGTGYTYFTVQR